MKFILGKKIAMTQIFLDNGTVVPVTRVEAGPCVVTQVKTKERNGFDAVQIGFGKQKVFRIPKPERGHLEGINWEPGVSVRFLREVNNPSAQFKKGDRFTVSTFSVGEKIAVIGTSKGRGFQGVVKRHGFAGGPASHGHKDNLRMPGSIGAGGVQRVFKDMRMGGHMGDSQTTVKNLEIMAVKPEENELWIKGAIPGARNGLVFISNGEGEIKIEENTTDTTNDTNENTDNTNNTSASTENVLAEDVTTESVLSETVSE